jgi:hypothetical protein
MGVAKVIKDNLDKHIFNRNKFISEINGFRRYFALYDSINFNIHQEDGVFVAKSTDYKYGSIITSADSKEEIEKEIKDAILTSFGIPSAYANEAKVVNTGSKSERYATVK